MWHTGLDEGAKGSPPRPADGPGCARCAWPVARAVMTTDGTVAFCAPASGSFLSAPCPVPGPASRIFRRAIGKQAGWHVNSSSWRDC